MQPGSRYECAACDNGDGKDICAGCGLPCCPKHFLLAVARDPSSNGQALHALNRAGRMITLPIPQPLNGPAWTDEQEYAAVHAWIYDQDTCIWCREQAGELAAAEGLRPAAPATHPAPAPVAASTAPPATAEPDVPAALAATANCRDCEASAQVCEGCDLPCCDRHLLADAYVSHYDGVLVSRAWQRGPVVGVRRGPPPHQFHETPQFGPGQWVQTETPDFKQWVEAINRRGRKVAVTPAEFGDTGEQRAEGLKAWIAAADRCHACRDGAAQAAVEALRGQT